MLPEKVYGSSKNNDITSKPYEKTSAFSLSLSTYGSAKFVPFVG